MGLQQSAPTDTLWPAAGQHLRVTIERFPERMQSHVLFSDPSFLIIAGPIRFQRDIPCQPGEPIELSWIHPRGVCTLDAKVVGYELFDIPCWKVNPAADVKIVQRRQFVRVPAVLPVTVESSGGRADTTTRDLSEGGLGCGLPEELGVVVSDPVTVRLDLDGEPTTLEATVVRAVPEQEGSVAVGLSFEGVRPAVADRIRKLVLALQREERKRAAQQR